MNNGLSSFNSALFLQSVQRRLMRSGLTRTHLPSAPVPVKLSVKPSVNFAAARWLAATLSVTGLMGVGWLLEAHPVQAQMQAPAQAPAQTPVQPPAQVENPAQGGDGLPTLASPEVPAPNGAVPSAPPVAPPTQANTPRPNSQLEAGGFFEPSINPTLDPRIPPVLSVPGTQVNPASLSESFNGYHLGPGDSIFVSVQRYPDLSFQATLDLQGNVVLPIEGAVSLKGLTLAEATNKIRGLYDRYVTFDAGSSRDVSLTLVAQRSVEVTILGAVQRPGFYPLSDPSVATALLTAGGATRTSDLRTIQIQRRIPQGNGYVESRVDVDLFTPLKEGSALPDVRLEDGDVMVIPEIEPSQISSYDRNLVARSTLAQPIINVRFLNYAGGRGGVGTLNLNNGSTFLDAVSLLGVNADTANLGDVALIRYDAETGRAVTISVDAKQAIQGDITQNPPLEDTDVIVVGRNLVGRLSFALQTITRPFRDVAGFSNFFNDFLNNNSFP
jgi:polysaccharide biosynthesis/export protein